MSQRFVQCLKFFCRNLLAHNIVKADNSQGSLLSANYAKKLHVQSTSKNASHLVWPAVRYCLDSGYSVASAASE